MIKPTFGSLFSGIGGIDLGLERAGWKCSWQVENDAYCNKVLSRHWPDTLRYGDIHGINFADLPTVDLLCGGFPCQPVSHAGRREGIADARWLWPEMLRAIRESGPTFILAENVYGLVTHNAGILLESVYLDLEAEGYETAPPIVFPAAALGAIHRRDRVWICAYSGYDGWASSEQWQQQEEWAEGVESISASFADSLGSRQQDCQGGQRQAKPQAWSLSSASLSGLGSNHWLCEPAVGRLVHGLSAGMERSVFALGNSVVPQCAELIGKLLYLSARPI